MEDFKATCSICGETYDEVLINMIDYDVDVCLKCEPDYKKNNPIKSTNNEPNIVGTFVCETTDWSIFQIAEFINKIQEKEDNKLFFTGTDFEQEGTEYQLLIASHRELSEEQFHSAVFHAATVL